MKSTFIYQIQRFLKLVWLQVYIMWIALIAYLHENNNALPMASHKGGVNPIFLKHIECCNFQTITVMYIKVYNFWNGNES